MEMFTFFVDMDGTLARFYDSPTCLEDMYEKDFFLYLSPYVKVLFAIKKLIKDGEQVKILSSCINEQCKREKKEWLKVFLPELKQEDYVLCDVSEKKSEVASSLTDIRRAILLDDYSHNLHDWVEAGGIGVKMLNGLNGNKGTWSGATISSDSDPDEICRVMKKLKKIKEEKI